MDRNTTPKGRADFHFDSNKKIRYCPLSLSNSSTTDSFHLRVGCTLKFERTSSLLITNNNNKLFADPVVYKTEFTVNSFFLVEAETVEEFLVIIIFATTLSEVSLEEYIYNHYRKRDHLKLFHYIPCKYLLVQNLNITIVRVISTL